MPGTGRRSLRLPCSTVGPPPTESAGFLAGVRSCPSQRAQLERDADYFSRVVEDRLASLHRQSAVYAGSCGGQRRSRACRRLRQAWEEDLVLMYEAAAAFSAVEGELVALRWRQQLRLASRLVGHIEEASPSGPKLSVDVREQAFLDRCAQRASVAPQVEEGLQRLGRARERGQDHRARAAQRATGSSDPALTLRNAAEVGQQREQLLADAERCLRCLSRVHGRRLSGSEPAWPPWPARNRCGCALVLGEASSLVVVPEGDARGL